VATAAWSRSTETEHLKVQLLSDVNSVVPGKPFWVGLHFEMEKGWHIYWRNPGDSGEPPRVQWNLPSGFLPGKIEWPAPARLGSGSVIDYGYEETVLLPVEMRTPESLAPGQRVTLSAAVSWLVCRDICVPGKESLKLSLPVQATESSMSASHALFQEAKSRAPKPFPSAWRVAAISEKDRFVLTVHGSDVAKASFFPLETDQIDNAAPQALAAIPGGVRLTLKKSDRLLKTPATLAGVLEVSPDEAYDVLAPVQLQH
jgi:thiol:disulfide interchange protein DsbD